MGKAGLRALEEQLRGPAPEGISRLPEEQLSDLTDSIRASRHRQAAELEAAADKAMALVPKLLRGPIRRMLG